MHQVGCFTGLYRVARPTKHKIQDFCFGILTGGQVFSSRTFLVRCILDIADETNSADGGENPDYGFLGCDTE